MAGHVDRESLPHIPEDAPSDPDDDRRRKLFKRDIDPRRALMKHEKRLGRAASHVCIDSIWTLDDRDDRTGAVP